MLVDDGLLTSGQAITSRTGRYKIFPVIGTVLLGAGAVLFATQLHWDTSLVEVDVYMAIFGIGLGLCMQTLTLATQNAVPPRDMGVATSSATFFRPMGGTVGTAVFLSLLFSTVGGKIADAFQAIVPTQAFQTAIHTPSVVQDPSNAMLFAALKGGNDAGGALQDSSFIQKLNPAILAQPFQEGFTERDAHRVHRRRDRGRRGLHPDWSSPRRCRCARSPASRRRPPRKAASC